MAEQTFTSNSTNTKALALVESWLQEACPETLGMKGVHLIAKIAELCVWTFKDAGTPQCHPGRAYLSSLVGWSVTKVSRFTSKLKEYKLLQKHQPRLFDPERQQWMPLTTVYSLPFLTRARIRQLASILNIDVRARMNETSFFKKKEKKSCVRGSIQTKNPILQKLLNRFANLGKTEPQPRESVPRIVETHPLLRLWKARGERIP